MNNSELTDKLGFYYVVFQPTLDDDIIKCWIDGDESFELYSPKELIKWHISSQAHSIALKLHIS